jgi:hypothetical protein
MVEDFLILSTCVLQVLPTAQGTHSVYNVHYSGGQGLDATKTMQQLKKLAVSKIDGIKLNDSYHCCGGSGFKLT